MELKESYALSIDLNSLYLVDYIFLAAPSDEKLPALVFHSIAKDESSWGLFLTLLRSFQELPFFAFLTLALPGVFKILQYQYTSFCPSC